MNTLNTAFQRELEKLVTTEIQRLKDNLSTSVTADLPELRLLMGEVKALQGLTNMFEEVATLLSQR